MSSVRARSRKADMLQALALCATSIQAMAEQKILIEIISRHFGHANSKVTREIYFHTTKKMKSGITSELNP